MKIEFEKCPKCKKNLEKKLCFTQIPNEDPLLKKIFWQKYCPKLISHRFSFIYNLETEEVLCIQAEQDDILYKWFPTDNKLFAIQHPSDSADIEELPWFTPNFSDWNHLLNKLKTYILFS